MLGTSHPKLGMKKNISKFFLKKKFFFFFKSCLDFQAASIFLSQHSILKKTMNLANAPNEDCLMRSQDRLCYHNYRKPIRLLLSELAWSSDEESYDDSDFEDDDLSDDYTQRQQIICSEETGQVSTIFIWTCGGMYEFDSRPPGTKYKMQKSVRLCYIISYMTILRGIAPLLIRNMTLHDLANIEQTFLSEGMGEGKYSIVVRSKSDDE